MERVDPSREQTPREPTSSDTYHSAQADAMEVGKRVSAEVVAQVSRFAPWLRSHGFRAAAPETEAALSALTHLDLTDEGDVICALRAVYAKSPAQWGSFESLFRRYFRGEGRRFEEKRRVGTAAAGGQGQTEWREEEQVKVAAMSPLPGYSRDVGERYAVKVDGAILKAVARVTSRAVSRVPAPLSRKLEPALRGRVDLRRTTKTAMRTAGQVQRWLWRRAAPDRPRIVMLMDVSGSMKSFAPFLTTLAWTFLHSRARAEVFLFSTRLVRVTALLRRRGLTGLSERDLGVSGLQGGTRIGDSLSELLDRHRGIIHRHTVLVIASDGFDAGHPERLHTAFEALRQCALRIVWLNPLLFEQDYDPTISAMRTALPYLDAFVDVHDVATWQAAVDAGLFAQAAVTARSFRSGSLRWPG
ncbi:vWA domain-containing protein [Alicyclobacillus sp. ALC3]|uniref:vWA domain-containing protein n=1 Tax=Alicyclobacillus sp. ALC3 TaxID=2796143 RepID=UPI002377FC56|nr:VWA domain-containing protein [Alicyclobacillus sp. ALC3]